MITENALASIVILNYRRRADLVRTIDSCLRQNYPSIEIIVVDNRSEDGTPEFIAQQYPGIRVLALTDNAGCAGRNRGVTVAHGDIVITIDNDVFFDSDFEVSKAVRALSSGGSANCIVFKVLRADDGCLHVRDWCHPRDWRKFSDSPFETCFIAEGASAFRREDFVKIGGYWAPLWIGCEGWDLALRMLDAGMTITYTPEVRVRHAMSHETRASGRNFYFYTRNYIWIARKDYSGWRRWTFVTYQLAMLLWFTLRTRNLDKFYQGVRDGFFGLRDSTRTPISAATFQRVKGLEADRPGIVARIRRHWAKPLI